MTSTFRPLTTTPYLPTTYY